MSFLLYQDSSLYGILLCIALVIILILIQYINAQSYATKCYRRLDDIVRCSKMISIKNTDIRDSMVGDPDELFRYSVKNPEKGIHDMNTAGVTLRDELNTLNDVITTDPLIVEQNETTDEQLIRSLTTADYDGPQVEGMSAPIEDFERSAMKLQLASKPEIYGDLSSQYDVSANLLSESNL